MKKTLTTLLFSTLMLPFILFGSGKAIAQDNSNPLSRIPERLKNYRTGKVSMGIRFPLYTYSFYDVDFDGRPDVIEAFRILSSDRQGVYSMGSPFSFAFDLDGDGKFSKDEFLYDPGEDELNGNEKWLNGYQEPLQAESRVQGI